MRKNLILCTVLWLLCFSLLSCAKKVKVLEDEIYSRHLQQRVKITVISTPYPENKQDLNLLILNDGQDWEQWRIVPILDSLWKKKAIEPLLVVAVHAAKREDWYGVSSGPDFAGRGNKAKFYSSFIENELYNLAKKRAGVRKFNRVAIAGASLGALSAIDIAWNNDDKIDAAGCFSGAFWWRDKDANQPGYADSLNRIVHKQIKQSRKKNKLNLWFYHGFKEEAYDRDKDGIIDVADDAKDLIKIIEEKKLPAIKIKVIENSSGKHDYSYWSAALPEFLVWTFGNK